MNYWRRAFYIMVLISSIFFILPIISEAVAAEARETIQKDKEVNAVKEKPYTIVTLIRKSYLYAPDGQKIIAVLNDPNTKFEVTETKNKKFYAIAINQNTYWIKKANLIRATGKVQLVKPTINMAIKTQNSYAIYTKPTKTSTKLFKGMHSVTYKILAIKNGFFVVQIGNNKGYLAPEQMKLMYKVKKNVEVIQNETALYEVKKGKKKKIGSLVKGATFTISKIEKDFVYVKKNQQFLAIAKNSVIPSGKSESLKKETESKYVVLVKASKSVSVFNKKGYKIGTIRKGQHLNILNIKKSKGVISFLGKNGYVPLTNFQHKNVVDTTKKISYKQMVYYLQLFSLLYPDEVELQQIGKSVEGRPLYAYHLGKGKKEILIDASTHAREHMTTNVVMEMIDQYTYAYTKKQKLFSYNVKKELDQTSIWFVPMVNPDGVTLVQSGLNGIKKENRAKVLKYNQGSKNFARYKANIRGVDINRNYANGWSKPRDYQAKRNYDYYSGPAPASEPETRAMQRLIAKHNFKTYLAYHSSGQVQYWAYNQSKSLQIKHRVLVRKIQKVTGYPTGNEGGFGQSGTGVGTDYFIYKTKNPGITIEIAPYVGKQPVPLSYWPSIWQKNKSVGLLAARDATTRK